MLYRVYVCHIRAHARPKHMPTSFKCISQAVDLNLGTRYSKYPFMMETWWKVRLLKVVNQLKTCTLYIHFTLRVQNFDVTKAA